MRELRLALRWHLWAAGIACVALVGGQIGLLAGLPGRAHGGAASGGLLSTLLPLLALLVSLALIVAATWRLRALGRALGQVEQQSATAEQRAEALDLVLAATQALWSQRSRSDLLQSLATAAHRLVGAAAAMAYLRDEKSPATMKRVALLAPHATLVGRPRLPLPAAGAGVREEYSEDEGRILLLPLEPKGMGVVGLLRLAGVPDTVDQEVLKALASLVAQAAGALKNAQLHETALAQALSDSLTGLLNYKALQNRLKEEVARARRGGRPLCLMMVDLDNFRTINNEHGHQAGDAMLVAVAGALRDTLRLSDVAARQGGDEFCVILPETELDEAIVVAERVCAAIAARTVVEGGETIRTSASIGVAALPDHASSGESLVRAADQAAYAAKHSGKGRVCRPEDVALTPDRDPAVLAAQLEDANMATVEALAGAVDAKDAYTRGHSQRVSAYAVALAEAMGFAEADVTRIRLAGLLHDVGKIGVPDAILTKHGALSDEEFAKLAQHPVIGERMLAAVPFLRAVLPAVRHHHERWDGRGYPDGLSGSAIPLDAAILMVADSFDAMTSSRNYRPAMRVSEACQRVREGSGQQFDPRVVDAFERAFGEGTLKPLSPGGTVMFRGDGAARASTGPLSLKFAATAASD